MLRFVVSATLSSVVAVEVMDGPGLYSFMPDEDVEDDQTRVFDGRKPPPQNLVLRRSDTVPATPVAIRKQTSRPSPPPLPTPTQPRDNNAQLAAVSRVNATYVTLSRLWLYHVGLEPSDERAVSLAHFIDQIVQQALASAGKEWDVDKTRPYNRADIEAMIAKLDEAGSRAR